MDQLDHNNRNKRTRSEDPLDNKKKKIKHSKRQQDQQQGCYNNNTIDTINNTNIMISSSRHDDDHGGDADVAGVFDFPWLKDGGGVAAARSDEWKLEDAFVTQLGESISLTANHNIFSTTVTTPAGIEFSFPGQWASPAATAAEDERFDEEEHEPSPPSRLEDIGFETVESLDCIWSNFA